MHKDIRTAVLASQTVGHAGFPALLMDRGLISRNDLVVARQHAQREGIELADAFVVLGLVPEAECYAALAEAAGLNMVDAVVMATSELAIRLVPERLARRHVVVPLSVDNKTLTYATCRPFDPEIERDLSFASGRRLTASVASRSGVLEALERCYPKLRELDVLAARLSGERPVVEGPESQRGAAIPSPSTVIDLCDHIIARAVEVGASDVHIECGAENTTVRYRICGVLEPVLTLPGTVSSSILNRFKIMARADIAIHHRPQDGAFRLKVNGRPIDIRLSTLPTVQGEKIVMRVIDSYSPLQSLDRLFYDDETLARLRQSLARPDGLILVTGPTGSGKTTALYAALAHLRTGRTNIVSVEDPVERTVPGVTQVPVNPRGGTTFTSVLRSLMRQDPNVIMVGEIRDEEVAQIVGQAAYTGHLVLSSMHTMDAATAITRLANLGLEPYKIAESLSAVLAQRLLRSLCPSCKRLLGDADGEASAGSGCQHCNHTGFLGRVPVAELLTPSDALRAAISAGAGAHEIRAAMRAAGYPTMRDRALQLVAAGVTSIEEVNRVLTDNDSAANVARERPRILIVDDDAITRMLVKLLLERDRYEVLEAANGRDAVEIAGRERPDLLIIDLNMPEMDGYEAIANLRKDLSMATLPIVVLTSEEGPGIERRVLELGADDYMLKPFDPDVLLSRVNAVFRRLKVMVALLLAIVTGGMSQVASAQGTGPQVNLAQATIEDLMNITITSAARKEQRMGDVPAAVYVITAADIRRSGMTTVPELLRLVPGVQVAQINANKWAVAVRGFNNLFGDKLLVLVDGRTVYDRLNSGMFWESLDIPLDLIERIEVTRGPGGATWGANAVNGVISIVTKHAADTAGAAVTVGAGTFDGTHVSARYGAARGRWAYRLSSQFAGHGESRLGGTGSDDSWQSQTHRARLDWTGSANTIMVTGDTTLATLRGLFHPVIGPVPGIKPASNDQQYTQEYDVLGRWARRLKNGSSLEVQSFLNYRHNEDPVNPRQTQADVDAQYHTSLSRHDLVMGGGYRFLHEQVDGGFALSISPSTVTEGVFNVFVQDDIAFGRRLHVMLGAKVERNGDFGTSLQPTARVMWAVVPRQHQVWAGVSRAVRRPSLTDLTGRYNYASFIGQGGLPVLVGALGNPEFKSEEVVNVEAGYRFEAGSVASLDITAFQGRYDNLKTNEPVTPYVELTPAPRHLFVPVQFDNLLKATTSGAEISAHLTPVAWWRLDVGYSAFHLAPHLSPVSRDVAAASFDGNVPRAQWQARSAFSFPAGVQLDTMLFHTGALRVLGVGAYTRADVRLEAPLTGQFTVSIVGQNLLSPQHAEYAGVGAIVTPTRIPRSARVQLMWRHGK